MTEELEAIVKSVIEKERLAKIEQIKEDVFNLIKENNGKYDLIDITCAFKQYTVDISCLAVARIEKEGRIKDVRYGVFRHAYFVRDTQ